MTRRPCSHYAPDSCPDCDGTAAEQRDIARLPAAQRRALQARNAQIHAQATTPTTRKEVTSP